MRVLTQSELNRATRTELSALLHLISAELLGLAEGSTERRNAQCNLANIRRALSSLNPGFRL